MADDVDRLQEREQPFIDALALMRRPTLQPRNLCHNCDEPLAVGLFCDADCREDHEKRAHMRYPQPQFR